MQFEFLGGASEVGRLGTVFHHNGRRMLAEYGMLPSTPPKIPAPAPSVDLCLLTHAHLDHSGMVPWVAGRYGMPIWATECTAVVSNILTRDSQKIAEMEGYNPPFSESDATRAWELYDPIDFGDVREWAGISIEAMFAGHIPGATMFRLIGDREILYTGDINTQDTLLVGGVKPMKTDVLFLESTYAGREHPERRTLIGEFLDDIDTVVERGGKVIIPVFAVGRTQEIIMMLQHTGYEVWMDGMGREICQMYAEMPRFLNDVKGLKKAMHNVRWIRAPSDRKKALDGDVIVTTSGMLDGGPILQYMKALNSSNNAIFLTGYQVEGTNGRLLLDRGSVRIAGAEIGIKCEIRQFDFSAHAGHSELLDFAEACDPDLIVLMHGDNREALARDLTDRNIMMPFEGEVYDL